MQNASFEVAVTRNESYMLHYWQLSLQLSQPGDTRCKLADDTVRKLINISQVQVLDFLMHLKKVRDRTGMRFWVKGWDFVF